MENSNRQTRLLLALFLSMGVWFFINQAFLPPIEKQKKETQSFKPNPPAKRLEKLSVNKKNENSDFKKKVRLVEKIPNKKVYLITNPFIVEFDNLGARIQRFYLKDHENSEGENVWLVRDKKKILTLNNKKYKVIEISREKGFDFNFFFDIKKIKNSKLNLTTFETNFDQKNLKVEFKTQLPYNEDITFIKEYQFFKEENYFKVSIRFINNIDETVILSNQDNRFYFRSFGSLGRSKKVDSASLDFSRYFRFYYSDDAFEDYIDGTSSKGFINRMFNSSSDETFSFFRSENKKIDFVGSGSRYFVAVFNPLNQPPSSVMLDNRENNTTGVLMVYEPITLKPNSKFQLDYAAYVGIREGSAILFHNQKLDPFQNPLDSPFIGLSPEIDESFNQGLTTPFRNAIVWILKKFYFVVPNYGWCIIIFSIIFKLSFYPLNQKQANSMKKMQELAPELKDINERYKDPKKRQEKTLEIYKKHKVNPMSGCLPIVVQIPIFIALYTAFSDTIDLWRSPFLWVPDLSEPDTVFRTKSFWFFNDGFSLNILPLIMVGTQFIQTKMTSVTTDPNQKTIMYVMPVIMLYFFWSMPSGVTLYWTVQNILSIIQQYITNKTKVKDTTTTLHKKGKKI